MLTSASIASAAAIAQTFKAIDAAHEAKGLHRRGALLAQIDLYSSLVRCADAASAADALAVAADTSLQLIREFITRFSALSSCALDLSPYLARLTPQLLQQLLQQLLLLPPHALACTADLDAFDSAPQLARRCASVCSVNRITAMAQSLLQPVGPFETHMPRLIQVPRVRLDTNASLSLMLLRCSGCGRSALLRPKVPLASSPRRLLVTTSCCWLRRLSTLRLCARALVAVGTRRWPWLRWWLSGRHSLIRRTTLN